MICTICGKSYDLRNKHGGRPKKRQTCGDRGCQNRWTWLAKLAEYRKKKLDAYYKNKEARPEYVRDINRRAKAKQRFGVNSREEILAKYNYQCVSCKSGDKLVIHHRDNLGRSVEGKRKPNNAPENLVVLCAACHLGHHKGRLKMKV